VVLRKGKKINLFNEIDERALQYDSAESRITKEDFQKKDEAENGNCDELLEGFHKEIEFLERLLKEPEGEMKLLEPDGEKGVEDSINKYDVEIREIEQRLFEGEMKDQEQQGSYIFRYMKETEVLI